MLAEELSDSNLTGRADTPQHVSNDALNRKQESIRKGIRLHRLDVSSVLDSNKGRMIVSFEWTKVNFYKTNEKERQRGAK